MTFREAVLKVFVVVCCTLRIAVSEYSFLVLQKEIMQEIVGNTYKAHPHQYLFLFPVLQIAALEILLVCQQVIQRTT